MAELQGDNCTDSAGTGPTKFPKGFLGGSSGAIGADVSTPLTITSPRQISVPTTADRTYTLPATALAIGDTWVFTNTGSANLNIVASDASAVSNVVPGMTVTIVAASVTPTTNASWYGVGDVGSMWIPFTVSYGGTPTTGRVDSGYWRRRGNSMGIRIQSIMSNAGSTGSGSIQPVTPFSKVLDTTQLFGTALSDIWGVGYDNTGRKLCVRITSGVVIFDEFAAALDWSSYPQASADTFVMNYEIPIVGWSHNL